MASIKKIGDQYRVRYFLHLPGGRKVDRSRRVDKKGRAVEVRALAENLEYKTSRGNYSRADLALWEVEGLVTRAEARQLIGHDHTGKTLAEAIDDFRRTWGEVTSGECLAREGRIKKLVEILGEHTPISTITYLDGERVKTTLRENSYKRHPNADQAQKLKATTINKHLQDLKRIFKIQLAMQTIQHFPFTILEGVKIPRAEKISHVALSEEQIAAVITKAEEQDRTANPPLGGHLTLFLLLFFGCGLRRSEALAAKLENINWQSRELLLTETKTDQERTVGLGQRLFDLLLPRKGTTGHILPRFHKDTVTRSIMRHFQLCGLEMRLHDTRHTYVTRLLDLGVSKRLAMPRTGHKDERMLDHYDHPEAAEIYEDNFDFMRPR